MQRQTPIFHMKLYQIAHNIFGVGKYYTKLAFSRFTGVQPVNPL